MKPLFYVILTLIIPMATQAQTTPAADQEKLLEYYQSQRFIEAAKYLGTLYSPNTENPKELAQLAYSNMMAGNLAMAEKSYIKLYSLQPNSLPVLFNLASISRRRGDEAKSKSYYMEIIKIDSLNFNVYKQLAAMVLMPIAPEKVFYLKKANAIQPTNPDVAFDFASSLNLLKKNDSAYVVLQTALAADTSNMALLKAKMPVCIALDKLDETIKTGDQLMAYGDSSSYVLNNLGKAYYIKKNYQKALDKFLDIEKLQQQNESTLYYTSLCYRELNNFSKAAEYMKMTIKESISPSIAKYYKILGEIYEKNSMVKTANLAYHKSLDFENDGGVFYNLGLINDFKMNNKKEALKYYNQYLASKPDPEKMKEVIDYVKFRITELKKPAFNAEK